MKTLITLLVLLISVPVLSQTDIRNKELNGDSYFLKRPFEMPWAIFKAKDTTTQTLGTAVWQAVYLNIIEDTLRFGRNNFGVDANKDSVFRGCQTGMYEGFARVSLENLASTKTDFVVQFCINDTVISTAMTSVASGGHENKTLSIPLAFQINKRDTTCWTCDGGRSGEGYLMKGYFTFKLKVWAANASSVVTADAVTYRDMNFPISAIIYLAWKYPLYKTSLSTKQSP